MWKGIDGDVARLEDLVVRSNRLSPRRRAKMCALRLTIVEVLMVVRVGKAAGEAGEHHGEHVAKAFCAVAEGLLIVLEGDEERERQAEAELPL